MKKSIFRKITLIILLVVLLFDAALLAVSYRLAYNRSYNACVNRAENAANMMVDLMEFVVQSSVISTDAISTSMTLYCEHLDLPYIYAFEVDKQSSSIKYIAIGFGKEATQEGRDTLAPGYVEHLKLSEELLDVYEKRADHAVQHVKNGYGDTLIYYLGIWKRYDKESGKLIDVDENPVVIGVDVSLSSVMEELRSSFNIMTVLLVGLSVSIVLAVAVILYRKISRPARMISHRMSRFVEDYERGIQPLPVKGEDEFAEMSRSFNTMAENIHTYVDSIQKLNHEKATRQAELDIAGDIQLGLLGKPHQERDYVRIDARMHPARDVGGDLYDYQILEDGRVFLAVADVSGKGITAALFMSRAVTLLHLYAKMGYSPAEILKQYNDTLSENNPGGLFITTFVAVYDPKTQELTYSNGGHNIPYVLSDELTQLDGARCMAAGLFPGEDYEETVVRLKKGDVVFLYTDGVNEAVSADGKLYTNERLEEKLSKCLGADEASPLEEIASDLHQYTEGAEQSDDITILTLKVLDIPADADPKETVLLLPADAKELPKVKDAILALPVDEDMQKKLYLVAEEMFINVCAYAYEQGGEVEVRIALKDTAELTFTDSGRPFDPSKDVVELDEYDYDKAVGGLGRFLTFTLADDYRYEYKDGKNVLWLSFQL